MRTQLPCCLLLSFVLVAPAALAQPVITNQPRSTAVAVGGTAVFSVGAEGPMLTYQWTFNSSNISGATNSTLTIANARFTDAGTYFVRVSFATNTIISTNVTLTVTNPIVIGTNLCPS